MFGRGVVCEFLFSITKKKNSNENNIVENVYNPPKMAWKSFCPGLLCTGVAFVLGFWPCYLHNARRSRFSPPPYFKSINCVLYWPHQNMIEFFRVSLGLFSCLWCVWHAHVFWPRPKSLSIVFETSSCFNLDSIHLLKKKKFGTS